MPCYQPTEYDELRDSARKGAQWKKRAKQLEGIVCALAQELRRRGIYDTVITACDEASGMDVSGVIKTHLKDDAERLIESMRNYSRDELEMMRMLIDGFERDDKWPVQRGGE